MKCTECGAEVPQGSKFCRSCGAPVVQKLADPLDRLWALKAKLEDPDFWGEETPSLQLSEIHSGLLEVIRFILEVSKEEEPTSQEPWWEKVKGTVRKYW